MLAFCLGLAQLTIAQDYVITNKGDTISGAIKLLSFDLLDRVQVKSGKEKRIFTAKEAKVCAIKGEFYRPVRQDNAIRFMKVLRYGYLSLYAFNSPNQHTFDRLMLAKLDGTLMEVPNLLFTKIIVNYLDDCPAIREKIKNEDYGKKDIERIVDEYNLCLEEKTRLAADAARRDRVRGWRAWLGVPRARRARRALAELRCLVLRPQARLALRDAAARLALRIRAENLIPKFDGITT